MHYVNISMNAIRGPEYIGSNPVIRATWLSLMGYCAELENGGVIKNCRQWGNRQWMQTCGVMLEEVNTESQLWNFTEDGSLVVKFFPEDQQEKCIKNRESGRKGGKKRAELEANAKASAQAGASTKEKLKEKEEEKLKEELKRKSEAQQSASNPQQNPEPENGQPDSCSTHTPECPMIPPCTLDQLLTKANMMAIPVEVATKFYNELDAVNWVDGKGRHISKPELLLQGYYKNWKNNEAKFGRVNGGNVRKNEQNNITDELLSSVLIR